MTIIHTYHTCLEQTKQLRPNERITRLRNMAWLQAGMVESKSVHLHHIAREIPGPSVTRSKEKRLSRYMQNSALRVRQWYEPEAMAILEAAAKSGGVVRLLLDGTQIGRGHQLLMVAIAYRRRAIPLVWTWVRSARGHSSAYKQCALLSHIHDRIPQGCAVFVAGDCEFGAVPVLRLLDQWQWDYALRQKGNHLWRLSQDDVWQRCDTIVDRPGQNRWLPQIQLTQKHAYTTNLLAYWQKNENEPWLLATNLASARETRHGYSRRAWIEEMFGDFKRHGFDLEATGLRHFERLSRLTLAVALLYLWLLAFGSQTIKAGKRRLVDRNDRRDRSIFRIGYDMLIRCLANSEPITIRHVPYF